MNRHKREEKRKHDEARKGLTSDQRATLDLEDENILKVEKLARKIHAEKFPEEYDFMYDSNWDFSDRQKGKNPMSQEHIDEVRKKRADLGVSQLSESGMPVANDTMALCTEEAKKIIYGP